MPGSETLFIEWVPRSTNDLNISGRERIPEIT